MADIFLVDFDKTISFNDSTDALMKKHNPEGLRIIREKYRNKELTIMGFIKTCLESLNITKEEYKLRIPDLIDFLDENIKEEEHSCSDDCEECSHDCHDHEEHSCNCGDDCDCNGDCDCGDDCTCNE